MEAQADSVYFVRTQRCLGDNRVGQVRRNSFVVLYDHRRSNPQSSAKCRGFWPFKRCTRDRSRPTDLNLERNTAESIQILVLCSARKRILEIGTSNGYSALWLGTALRAIPGAQRLETIERDAGKVRQARSTLQVPASAKRSPCTRVRLLKSL